MDITARRLCAARYLRELSIRQLARAAGVSKSALHRYETGQVDPPPMRIVDLAGVLEVDSFWLIGDETRQPCKNPADAAWLAERLDYVEPLKRGRAAG